MKRIIFCFDGTWNKLEAANPTNVVLVAESIFPFAADRTTQVIHYDDGVGTGGGDWKWKQSFERITGGIMGWGLLDNIREAYRFLIFNYELRDEIYVFGFSRGAYTARSFIGLLACASVIRRKDASQIENAVQLYRNRLRTDAEYQRHRLTFRAKYVPDMVVSEDEDMWRAENVSGHVVNKLHRLSIRYLGVWDTVGALGLPESLPGAKGFNARHQFHNPELPSFVESGRHAVALDERRRSFPVTQWENAAQRNEEKGISPSDPNAPIQEKWFPGTHGSVGGGGDIRGLSDAALAWIIAGAKRQGLELDTSGSSRVYELRPNFRAPLVNMKSGLDPMSKVFPKKDRVGPSHLHEVHLSAIRRWNDRPENLPEKAAYRPKSLERIASELTESGNISPNFTGTPLATHVVVVGDALRKIAKKYYGNPELSDRIFDANRDVLDDPDELHVGMELVVPKLEDVEDRPD